MSLAWSWPPGAATGVGSMPGTDVRESTRVVLGELPGLPHLPELPERGVGADLAGRGIALLVDLHAEVQPSGWRVADAAGRDERRARSLLVEDLDTLEELADGISGPLKLQVVGPWTLAAALELRHGDKALADPGACRDLAASLAEGVHAHVTEVRRRLPAAALMLQLDEPALPGVLSGTVPTASGFGRLAAVETEVVTAGLSTVLGALDPEVGRLVHCCAREVPFELLRRAGAQAVSFDLALLDPAGEETVGSLVEDGTRLLAGAVDAGRLSDGVPEASVVADSVALVRALWNRIGLPLETVAEVAVTPTCGLAGRSPAAARRALAAAREAGRRLAEDPEGHLGG